MKRREFITLLGGASTWPLVARAQQPRRIVRIGVLMSLSDNDPGAKVEASALESGLQILGWTNGANTEIDYRWPGGSVEQSRVFAKEIVALHPDILVARSTPATLALMSETQAIPIVFVQVADPVASGIVANLAKPGGNVTGFTNVEPSLGGKWLELLKEAAPTLRHVAIMFNPATAPYSSGFSDSIATAGRALKVEVTTAPVGNTIEIDTALAALAERPSGGLIVIPDTFVLQHREQVVALATKFNLPAIFSTIDYSRSGGMLCYGVDTRDLFRRAAAYVDKILRGVKPADLPVQQPVKFDLVVNMRTARALGLTIPESFLSRADQVIE